MRTIVLTLLMNLVLAFPPDLQAQGDLPRHGPLRGEETDSWCATGEAQTERVETRGVRPRS